MARGKDLAGLAALGALGMMLSKGKSKDKGADTSGMDTGGFEGSKNLSRRDTGMFEKEPAENFSRRDAGMFEKEPDENYAGLRTSSVGVGTVSPRIKTTAARTRTTPMTGSGGGRGPAAGEAEAYRQSMNRVPSLDTSKVSDVDLTGGAKAINTPIAKSGLKYQSLQDREIEAQAKRRAAGSSFYGTKTMAKGGMARSSASSRADGIASRGKTRGKVC